MSSAGASDQNERTALAWQRTALSVLVTAAVVSRFAVESIGAVGVVALAAATPVSAWIVMASRRRYRYRLAWAFGQTGRRDGRFEFAVAAVVVLMFLVLAAAVVI